MVQTLINENRNNKRKVCIWIVMVVGFLLSLYWVEASSWGSMAVARYNNGYGTFDMKDYDFETVKETLENTNTVGFVAYYKYYVADFVFLVFFGFLQCRISHTVYKKIHIYQNKAVKTVVLGIPILRGIFDIAENSLLLITIAVFPKMNAGMVSAASFSTQCKLWCIRIWLCSLGAAVVCRILQFFFKKSS